MLPSNCSILAIEYYWDETDGGFFFTASDHEELIVRSKTATDGAIPSGNSVMLGESPKTEHSARSQRPEAKGRTDHPGLRRR